MLTSKQGKKLIDLARKSILSYFDNKDIHEYEVDDKLFKGKKGVFVTLNLNGDLRGCIGFPQPIMPLYRGIIEAARASAFEDPRFLPLTHDEMGEVKIEISVLTKPKMIETKESNPSEISREIEIGKDGLIIEYSGYSGMLLPQVALEQKWNAEHFLEQTCMKAGVSPKSWKNKSCKTSLLMKRGRYSSGTRSKSLPE